VAGAAALRISLETPLAPCEVPTLERDIDTFRSSLSNRDFEAAWEFGSALSLERLITYAREQRLIPGDRERETVGVGVRQMAFAGRR
jgi:hypothetical protein